MRALPEGPDHGLTCQLHDGKPLEVFCETCCKLICLKCAVLDHKGAEHVIGDMRPMAEKCGVALTQVAGRIETRLPEIKLAKRHLETVLTEVDVQKGKAVLAARAHCDAMRSAVVKCQHRLEAAAEAEAAAKKNALREQAEGIDEFIEHAGATLTYSSWLVESGGASDVLEAMPLLRAGLDDMAIAAQELPLEPVVSSTLAFVVDEHTSELVRHIEMGGAVVGSRTDPSKCKVSGVLSYAGDGVLGGEPATFALKAYTFNGTASNEGGDNVEAFLAVANDGGEGEGEDRDEDEDEDEDGAIVPIDVRDNGNGTYTGTIAPSEGNDDDSAVDADPSTHAGSAAGGGGGAGVEAGTKTEYIRNADGGTAPAVRAGGGIQSEASSRRAQVSVLVNGVAVCGSPFTVTVRSAFGSFCH